MNKFIDIIINHIVNLFDKSFVFSQKAYSQEGEDLILQNIFSNLDKGFFVDVGAHHPFRFSNTYLFYKRGWRGINIDATPGGMDMFRMYRSGDKNIELAISNSNKKINYYIFDEPALNGFSEKISIERDKNTKYKIKNITKLTPQKLSFVLDKYLPKGKQIDFMSIDVEGFEYQVLLSNNWKKYIPRYLIVEILENEIQDLPKNKICKFLKDRNYIIIAVTGRSVIFKRL